MSENIEKKDDKSGKKPDFISILEKAISLLVILFCFIFFPGYFIHSSLSIFFENNVDELRQSKLIEMNQALEYLEKYSNNKRYFHYLLSKVSEYAQKSENPQEYLKANITNIKSKYPNQLEFVVWDEKGAVIKELSDRNNYSYVLKKLFEILKAVKESVDKDATVKVGQLELVRKNAKFVRNFLGRIFVAESLKYPVINNQNAGPLMTDLGEGFTNCWYSIGKKISMFCFLSQSVIKDFAGLDKTIKVMNRQKSDIITGFSVTPNYAKPVSFISEEYYSDIALGLTTFENASDSIFENERILMKMVMPQPNVRIFAFIPKADDVWHYQYKTNIVFGILYSGLLLVYCLLAFWFLVKKRFFYIRWKLTALFLFANLVPISIIGFIAKGYLDNKRFSIKNEVFGNLEKKLREFDAGYKSQLEDYKISINKIVDNIEDRAGTGILSLPDIAELEKMYETFNCSEMYLIASDSKIIASKHDDSIADQNMIFMSSFGEALIRYINNTNKIENKKKDSFHDIIRIEDSELVRRALRNNKSIIEFNVADSSKICYMRFFGDTKNYNNNYFFILAWDHILFQQLFIEKHLEALRKSFPDGIIYITSKDESLNIKNNDKLSDAVLSMLEKKSGMSEKTTGSIELNNKRYYYILLNSSNMHEQSMLGLYPGEKIDRRINLIIVEIVVGGLLSLLLTIIIGHILTLQILEPVKNLGEAALAIGNRNFKYRLPLGDKDEFGHLNQVFNRAIESLEDFEVARIVQESLFPGNRFDIGDFDIFGKSVVMTTLGGDYYDCFKINDDYQGIIIGDVAGHGIPAGLMMAMAKSGVLSASEEIKLDASVLTARLHKIFHGIKNEKLKRMMTFMYFVLRVSDGHFLYTNAGHCLPFVVDGNKKTAEYLDYIATPLGIGARCRCKNQEFILEKGQSLVLYTDGIVEANNGFGEQYGYDRFKDALIEHYDSNPEVFYDNIYNKVYKAWSPVPDDDLTFIIINRN